MHVIRRAFTSYINDRHMILLLALITISLRCDISRLFVRVGSPNFKMVTNLIDSCCFNTTAWLQPVWYDSEVKAHVLGYGLFFSSQQRFQLHIFRYFTPFLRLVLDNGFLWLGQAAALAACPTTRSHVSEVIILVLVSDWGEEVNQLL